MKKKIMAMVFAAMMMMGSMTTINGGTGEPCDTYSYACPNGVEGGVTGIFCGTQFERAMTLMAHVLDNCYGYDNALDLFPAW